MIFQVYILESLSTGEYYIGQTDNLRMRLERHNAGMNLSTKHAKPWKVIYVEDYNTRSEATRRERNRKRLMNRKR